MANNRMYLIHRPTGIGINLGKRMGYGWYNPPYSDEFQNFFDIVSNAATGSQDDFILTQECQESGDEHSCPTNWDFKLNDDGSPVTIGDFYVYEEKESGWK